VPFSVAGEIAACDPVFCNLELGRAPSPGRSKLLALQTPPVRETVRLPWLAQQAASPAILGAVSLVMGHVGEPLSSRRLTLTPGLEPSAK
jgi:hypothetical protein